MSAPFGHTAQVDASWPAEIAQDVEWAHAAAPGATIDVVQAATDQLQNPPSSELLATTLWAVKNLNPDVVVLPWGAPESVFASFYGNGFEAQFHTRFLPGHQRCREAGDLPGGRGGQRLRDQLAGGTSLAPQAFGYSSMPGSHLDCSGASGELGRQPDQRNGLERDRGWSLGVRGQARQAGRVGA